MSTSQTPKKPRKKKVDKLIGTSLAGKYRILKKIGEGGMGSVYVANQENIDRKVAVKVLLSKLAEDETAVKRFEQEAKAISKMQHPNTVTIYDFGQTEDPDQDGEQLFIVMEYLKGRTLTQVLRSDGQLAPLRAARIVRQVCASLADAHAAGIIHRDLKPDNIFLTEVGNDKDWVKVLDFGVAKLANSEGAGTLTGTGMIFGTPKYMSPEQAEGKPIDYRADIYALGVVLYELLMGRPPFVADTPVALLLKHISEPPTPFTTLRPDITVDPRLEAIVMKALDKRPEGRQQMVSGLATELEAFERTVSGPVLMPVSGTYPLSSPQGMPTEVVPGTLPGQAVTPADLQPPQAVPSQLSLGVIGEARTEGQSASISSSDRATQAHTAMPSASGQMTAHGLTQPIAVSGSGIDNIGGLDKEISGPVPRRETGQSKLYIGVGLLLLAVVVTGGLYVMQQSRPATVVATKPVEAAPPSKPESPPASDSPPPLVVQAPVPAPPPPAKSPRPRKPRRAPPVVESPPPPPAPSAKVTVRFESDPEGAMVYLNDKQLGLTPFSHDFVRDDVLKLRFQKRGYKRHAQMVATLENKTVSVKLERQLRSARPKPQKKPPPPPPSEGVEDDPLNDRVGELKPF